MADLNDKFRSDNTMPSVNKMVASRPDEFDEDEIVGSGSSGKDGFVSGMFSSYEHNSSEDDFESDELNPDENLDDRDDRPPVQEVEENSPDVVNSLLDIASGGSRSSSNRSFNEFVSGGSQVNPDPFANVNPSLAPDFGNLNNTGKSKKVEGNMEEIVNDELDETFENEILDDPPDPDDLDDGYEESDDGSSDGSAEVSVENSASVDPDAARLAAEKKKVSEIPAAAASPDEEEVKRFGNMISSDDPSFSNMINSQVANKNSGSGGMVAGISIPASSSNKASKPIAAPQRANVARKLKDHDSGYEADRRNRMIMEKSSEINKEMAEMLANLKETNLSIVDMLAKVNATGSQLRKEYNNVQQVSLTLDLQLEKSNNFLSDRYMENMHKAAERVLSSYIAACRNQYMEMFKLAVRNFQDFSSAAVNFQKKMEDRSSRQFKLLVRFVCYGIPFLIILNVILIALVVWKLYPRF